MAANEKHFEKIALTGASGMVGRRLLERLAARNIFALAASRSRPVDLPGAATWQSYDLTEWKELSELDDIFPDAGALIHAGASIPTHAPASRDGNLIDANVRSCLNLGLWAANRGIPVVFISSSSIYKEPEREGIAESDPLGPNEFGGVYALSKLQGEQVFRHLSKQEGLGVTVLRPSSIYGPGLPRRKMMVRFLEALSREETVSLSEPVNDRHCLIHASDVAEACIQVLSKGVSGVFNLDGGKPVTVKELAETCMRVVGRGSLEIEDAPVLRDPTIRFGLVCDAAKKAFGFSPEIGLEEGVTSVWTDIKNSPTYPRR